MKRSAATLLLLIAAAVAFAATVSRPHQSVGLVLSGGGAKGIAHIGVIQALEENDISIDYVAGTSMGAIVGSLYAMGYTPAEMMDLITSRDFGYWSTGTIDPSLAYYFDKAPESPAMFSFNIGHADSTAAVPASLISPLPMNLEFMRLFSPYTAACGRDFDRLMVPFRCVASDAVAKRKVVLSGGDLGSSVRASMSFPGVFQPTEIDGRLLYDGGLYDNFPLDVMRSDFAPDIMIGVDVSSSDSGPQTSILAQLETMICAPEPENIPADELVRLRLHLDRFGLLDFSKAREIYRIGYDAAIASIDSIRERVHARTPAAVRAVRRAEFRARVPYLRFDSLHVEGGTRQQNRYIRHLFIRGTDASADTFGIAHTREAYYRTISTGRIRDMRLDARQNDSTQLFGLGVRAFLRNDLQAGVGGYITSSTNSYLFLSGRWSTLSFHSVDAGVRAWLGQSYMAGALDARIYTPTRHAMSLGALAVASRRKYYENATAFFDSRQPVYVITKEYFGRLKWSLAAGRSGAVDIFGGAGNLLGYFYGDNTMESYERGRDRTSYVLWQAGADYSRNTLDSPNFPCTGGEVRARAMAVGGSYEYRRAGSDIIAEKSSPAWLQAELRTRHYISPSRRFSLGLESHTVLSTRKLVGDYNAAVASAAVFSPTPAAADAFRASFRANSFVAAGVVPVFRYNDALSARVGFYGFLPLRAICENADGTARYGRWLRQPQFYGEAAIAYRLPFASVAGWCNYSTGLDCGWNVGISFGIYITAPKFLQI